MPGFYPEDEYDLAGFSVGAVDKSRVLDSGRVRPGDVIVLAGKGHETYQEINGVQDPLDEREVVAEFFRAAALRQKGTGKVPADVV